MRKHARATDNLTPPRPRNVNHLTFGIGRDSFWAQRHTAHNQPTIQYARPKAQRTGLEPAPNPLASLISPPVQPQLLAEHVFQHHVRLDCHAL